MLAAGIERKRKAGSRITAAKSSSGLGSGVPAFTMAVFKNVPKVWGVAVRVSRAPALTASVPTFQITVEPARLTEPCVALVPVTVTVGGKVSITLTLVET